MSDGSLASEKGLISALSSSLKISIKMKPTFKKQLIVQNVQMDGSINFQTNGDINIYLMIEVNQVMSFFNTRKEETLWNQQ